MSESLTFLVLLTNTVLLADTVRLTPFKSMTHSISVPPENKRLTGFQTFSGNIEMKQ